MILRTLAASILENTLINMPHPFKNFEIKKYYQNETIFNGVYSRTNLPK